MNRYRARQEMMKKKNNPSDIAKEIPDVPQLHHQNGSIMNHHEMGWWAKASGKLVGEWITIQKGYRTRDGHWEIPNQPTRLADGTKLIVGEAYPVVINGRKTQWMPAPGDKQMRPFKTFGKASAAAVKAYSASGEWVRPVGLTWNYIWFDASQVPEKIEGAPKWSVKGEPCVVRVGGEGRGETSHACLRLVDRDDMCKLHATINSKKKASVAAWERDYKASLDRNKREAEASKRAEEILEEISPLLDEMGLRSNLFSVKSNGNISSPAEALLTLVERAVLLKVVKDMF